MKIAVIQFPGSNCEQESMRAVKMAGMEPFEFLWNQDTQLIEKADGFVIVGGFSYEDRSRAGIIAAMDPVMAHITHEASKGKPVLGICNGAQILVEAGLVPGLQGNTLGMALSANKRIQEGVIVGTDYYNAWVHIMAAGDINASAFTRMMKHGQIIRVPVAHGEGRFVIPNGLLEILKNHNQTTFRYVDAGGEILDEFPTNPNGSVYNLAAVTNASGNIMAIMPHPERTEDGQPIFVSMREYIRENIAYRVKNIDYIPPKITISHYTHAKEEHELIVQPIITDNTAQTVQKTLNQKGINVGIIRYIHWDIRFAKHAETRKEENDHILDKILSSGELFNSNKECVVEILPEEEGAIYLLVRDRDDFTGEAHYQTLVSRFDVTGLERLSHGILWKITIPPDRQFETLKEIIRTHILFNPFSQTCSVFTPVTSEPMEPKVQSDYTDVISRSLDNCLKETDLPIGQKYSGKVRDRYVQKDTVILITTDRQSAFDRVLASIPFKGQVLNQVSAWWFQKTAHIMPNHVLELPDPNVTIAKKANVFPVEFVVRGYITGTTSTSAWMNYEKGMRDFCGNILPEGLTKNQKFSSPIITPTTKADDHDRLISPAQIVAEKIMTQEDWNYCSRKAMELFLFGQAIAREHGLILADTKYEMGRLADGTIVLVDELHTPDSSRYWVAESCEKRLADGQEPENIDKEFLRLWFTKHCDPYNDKELPAAPEDLVVELSRRYIQLFEMITGSSFVFPDPSRHISERLAKNLKPYAVQETIKKDEPKKDSNGEIEPVTLGGEAFKAVLILGSEKDAEFAKKITGELIAHGIAFDQHVASAHKQAARGLDLIARYKDKRVVYITIAGRSNALSGFIAGNSNKPVIACPPFADKIDMMINIQSTLQMPGDVPVMTILEPSNVALTIKRILSLTST